jgi:DNA-directed RNA polymerase specialized sigma24 family protein
VPAVGVLDTLEATFRMLCRGPEPLALPGPMFTRGRRRPVRLVEARELLLWPDRMPPDARDAVWAELIRRAQTDPADPADSRRLIEVTGASAAAWVVGAAGVLAPGLRRVCDRLAAGWAGDRDDLEAEVLAGFLTALHTIDPDSGRLPARLCWAAYRAGSALRHRDTDHRQRRTAGSDAELSTVAPPRPWGHPDFVLATAVQAGTITATEAELIASTRLEGVHLQDAAADLGISRGTLLTRRNRAERRLAAAIRSGGLATATAPTATATATASRPGVVAEESSGWAVISSPEIRVRGCRTSTPPPQPGPSSGSRRAVAGGGERGPARAGGGRR